MQNAQLNGVDLEYVVFGRGEPLLLIGSVLADGFLPLAREPELCERFQLIHYHKRGWAGSTKTTDPVGIEEHARDAADLLDYLGVPRAHVAGHSSGAAIAAQLARDHPGAVHSLVLLELSLLSHPHGREFLERARPVLAAYQDGDHEGAFAMFMTAVSGLEWETCRDLLEEQVPGLTAQAIEDADTFFEVEVPALAHWDLSADQAADIEHPVLSVIGSETQPLWFEVAEFLRSTIPQVEDCTIDGVGHLLHLQRSSPVAAAIGEFLRRHPIAEHRSVLERQAT